MKPILYMGCPQPERAAAEKTLADAGMSIVWVDNGAHALNELQRGDMPVLVDLSRGGAALQVARDLRAQRPAVLLFAVADDHRPDLTVEAVLTGVADVFARPPAARRLINALEREKNYEARPSARTLEMAGDALYSQSPSMREVVALIARAASGKTGVTIRGEEGTGRQVVARAIHAAQHEGAAAFVSVDCAAHESANIDGVFFGGSARSATCREQVGPRANQPELPPPRRVRRDVVPAERRRSADACAGAAGSIAPGRRGHPGGNGRDAAVRREDDGRRRFECGRVD